MPQGGGARGYEGPCYNLDMVSDWKLVIFLVLIGIVAIFVNFYLFRVLKSWSLSVNKDDEQK